MPKSDAFYLGSDNLPRNYGDLFWFDPFPSSSQQVKVPTGEVDFYGVLLHEIFHCLVFGEVQKNGLVG